jgi:hypothetical protein
MEEMISLHADRIECPELDVIRDDIVADMYGVFPIRIPGETTRRTGRCSVRRIVFARNRL